MEPDWKADLGLVIMKVVELKLEFIWVESESVDEKPDELE